MRQESLRSSLIDFKETSLCLLVWNEPFTDAIRVTSCPNWRFIYFDHVLALLIIFIHLHFTFHAAVKRKPFIILFTGKIHLTYILDGKLWAWIHTLKNIISALEEICFNSRQKINRTRWTQVNRDVSFLSMVECDFFKRLNAFYFFDIRVR